MILYTFLAVHCKKGKQTIQASTSYEAAQQAARIWKLKSTAGIDVYRTDTTHVL